MLSLLATLLSAWEWTAQASLTRLPYMVILNLTLNFCAMLEVKVVRTAMLHIFSFHNEKKIRFLVVFIVIYLLWKKWNGFQYTYFGMRMFMGRELYGHFVNFPFRGYLRVNFDWWHTFEVEKFLFACNLFRAKLCEIWLNLPKYSSKIIYWDCLGTAPVFCVHLILEHFTMILSLTVRKIVPIVLY